MSYTLIKYWGDKKSVLINNEEQDYNDFVGEDVKEFTTFGSMVYQAAEVFSDTYEQVGGKTQHWSTEELAKECIDRWTANYLREEDCHLGMYERTTHVSMIMIDIEFHKLYLNEAKMEQNKEMSNLLKKMGC